MESDKKQHEKPKNPRATSNLFSTLTFSWTLPLFIEGYKRDLEVEDLFDPLKEHSSGYLGDKIEKAWDAELKRCVGKTRKPSFLRVIVQVFGKTLLALSFVIFFVEIILRIAQPMFLGRLIDHFSPDSTVTESEAYLSALGIILCSGLSIVIMHPYMMGIMHMGMKVRVAACSLIYRKALKLSKTALVNTTVGQIVNLLSNDVNRFDIAFIFLHNLWIGPLQTIIVTYILWQLIGPASLIGLGSLLMFIPLQAYLGKKTSTLRLITAGRTDERVRLMNEIISGIQVIKMYTWEKPFASLVEFARRREMNIIRKSSYIRGVMLSFIIFHTRTSVFCSILAYVLFGNVITAKKVFVVISYYNILRQTMTIFFPEGISFVAEAIVSVRRIQEFLLKDEIDLPKMTSTKVNVQTNQKEKQNDVVFDNYKPLLTKSELDDLKPELVCISANKATAKWAPDFVENTLQNITIEINPNSLTGIIGSVGSGKTSLLHVLLNELPLQGGTIKVSGKISYASQEPWLFAGSVKQNILFGEPFNKERYRNVIKVCALRTDFDQLPFGDKTVVGERGVSLSGGQRARINLARAVYKEADIYLLDDPLSAVDSHVGKHLFEDCVAGFLKKKTVILVTHQLQFLNNIDHIILMENGSIKAEGSYSKLLETGDEFLDLFQHLDENDETIGKLQYSRQSSVQSVASSVEDTQIQEPEEVAEARTTGTVTGYVYKSYLTAGGGCLLLILTFFMSFFAQLLASTGDYWISYWVNLEEHVYGNNSTDDSSTYLLVAPREVCIYIYSGIVISMIFVTLTRSYMLFTMCVKASINLHNKMFNSITRATMRFFNTNSSGRILNRFSKDMGSVDELLPLALIDCLQIGLALTAIITVVALMNFWLLIPTMIAAVIFYNLRKFYISTSRSVKRLEGITRSPVFAHLNASLQGMTTIRAFNAQNILQEEFDHHQDLHSSAWYMFISSSRAFGYWLDMVCIVYITLVVLSFLVLGKDSFGGNVGLAISQSIGLTGMFQWGMRQSAELENQMTSVERVLEYSDLDSEPPMESPPGRKPPLSWPESGKIVFNQVFLRYSASDMWVLKNLNFTIPAQYKIGIVGRTGAGKSSLIAALFRLTEVQGSIVIDEININMIGLQELRSKVSIIPQEPVLFSGTMRKNLDPFDQYTDEVLWYALEQVELKDVISEMPGGLNTKISEGGGNMSVGQRQLICLARAIIRNNKILVLDEATANVDPQTDALIQTTIRKKFASCTVLTIAHRLHTVMDSNKVLVMDSGCVVEFDHPHNLLQNKDGFLHKMVAQTGKSTSEMLYKMALESYKKLSKRAIPIEDDDIPHIDADVEEL